MPGVAHVKGGNKQVKQLADGNYVKPWYADDSGNQLQQGPEDVMKDDAL